MFLSSSYALGEEHGGSLEVDVVKSDSHVSRGLGIQEPSKQNIGCAATNIRTTQILQPVVNPQMLSGFDEWLFVSLECPRLFFKRVIVHYAVHPAQSEAQRQGAPDPDAVRCRICM